MTDRNPFDPLVVFISYAEPKRGSLSIDQFEQGKYSASVLKKGPISPKEAEDKLGGALDDLSRQFKDRCGDFGEKCAPGYQPPAQTPPAGGGGGVPFDFRFRRDFNFEPMPGLELRRDLQDFLKEKKKNGASTDTPAVPPEEKKPFPTAAVVGGLAVAGLVVFMLRKRG